MKPVFKIALISFLLNVLSCGLLFFEVLILLIPLSLLIQLIVGIVLALSSKDKTLGQGMLIGMGVFTLVGFSVCTIMLRGFH